ncbi:MAG: hypothetical protein PHH24_01685 [Candidatus Moranbacteria bacterium]|jgi:hypothetical protein|nr:hypothetical protein [Candidatus Moranbacteria bacterium]MDX9855275.1 hypothetical protein [Candidatus Moranbacteria bacterium]
MNRMTKGMAKELLRGDFVPNGYIINLDALEFRRTKDDEVYRCCESTGGYDPQSGPFYCGEIAEIVAFCENNGIPGYVGICEKCMRKAPAGLLKIVDSSCI